MIGYFAAINKSTEKLANFMLINAYPRLPPFLTYFLV